MNRIPCNDRPGFRNRLDFQLEVNGSLIHMQAGPPDQVHQHLLNPIRITLHLWHRMGGNLANDFNLRSG